MPRDREYDPRALAEIITDVFPVESDGELETLVRLAAREHKRKPDLSPAECCAEAWELRS